MAWRTNQSHISFDNLRVTGGPSSYNTLVYLHGDHLGSVGAVTTSGGALLDTTRFLPFGGYRGSDPAFLTESGFTGHRMNNTATNGLGLIYMNARYYVGAIGRFISADSLVPDPTAPQQFNRYTYSLNNPVKYSDPSGHNPCPPGPEYYECTRNFYGLESPDTTVSEVTNEIFEDMADEPDIPFAFPADGCYGRAHRMIQRIAERYEIDIDSIEKVSIIMTDEPLTIETEYVYPNINGEIVQWGWHVAPLLDVQMEDGRVVSMVIDPSLFDEPVTIETWAAIMNAPSAEVTVQDRHWYNPIDTNLSDEEATSDAVKCQEAKKAKLEQKAGKLTPACHLRTLPSE